MFDQVRAVFVKYTQIRSLDCQQRAIDFSTLAKYNAALKRSQNVNIDPNLSFLNAFVAAEKLKGAAAYDPKLQVKAAALGPNAGEVANLNFGPYSN